MGLERVPIRFEIERGNGYITVGQAIEAELAPFQGVTGQTTTLYDTVFTTIPGSPLRRAATDLGARAGSRRRAHDRVIDPLACSVDRSTGGDYEVGDQN